MTSAKQEHQPRLVVQTGNGLISSVAFSPDGKRVLTGSQDKTARLWDVDSGKELRQFKGHSDEVSSVAFSPDGKRALTGSGSDENSFTHKRRDNTARLWDVDTSKQLQVFEGHSHALNSVALSSDGTRVLTGSFDGIARLWDFRTGRQMRQFEGHSNEVTAVAFSRDSERALTGSADLTIRLWDLATGRSEIVGEILDPVSSIAFSPDGKHVLAGNFLSDARLWDVETGNELQRFTGHEDEVMSVAFSPDGKRVLTGSNDNTARLWDIDGGEVKQVFKGHTGMVMSVAFTPDGTRVLTGSFDTTSRLWDTKTGKELCRLISFDDGNWAVLDPQGRFDGSDSGDIEGLHWVIGNEPIALDQLKERYYEPGLLAKLTQLEHWWT